MRAVIHSFTSFFNSWVFSLYSPGLDTWRKNNNLCLNPPCESVKNTSFTHKADGIFYLLIYFKPYDDGKPFHRRRKQASCGCYLWKVKFPLNGRERPTEFLLAGCGEEFVSLPLLSLGETHTPTYRWGSSEWESNLMGLQLCQQELKDPGVEKKKIKTREISGAKDERRWKKKEG